MGKLLIIFCGLLVVAFKLDSAFAEEMLAKDRTFQLIGGDKMPMVGFGTYKVQGYDLIKNSLDLAFSAGYRLIDSATAYQNEEDIGKALKELLPKHNLKREDIFITSKLSPRDQGPGAYAALQLSLKKLDCGYIDLYLIHWPGAFSTNGSNLNNATLRDQSWEQLARGVKNGFVRNIGVSNYNVRHMKELLAKNHGVKPAVNQVEWHPHYHQAELKDFCEKEHILLQAYSSLGGTNNTDLIRNPQVVEIAKKLNKSPAQVLLRWSLQQNIAVIPKARSKQHIDQNIDLNFVIPDEDMKTLENLPQQKKLFSDPNTIL